MADPAEDRGDNLDELMPDAALATDIPDEKAREEEQLKYYGGEKDDVDDEDLSSVDRGDSIEPPELEDEEEEEEQAADDEGDEPEDSDGTDDDGDSDDAEAEDEDADEDDQDDSEEEPEPQRDQRIPLSRFNEVNERMKRAEARLAELERQETATQQVEEGTYDFDAAEEEYTELLLNGDTKGAATKRAEIRSAEREAFLQEANLSAQESLNQDAMMSELNSLSTQASQMYPVFDDSSPEFSQEATQKVLTFMRGYMSDERNPLSPGDAFVAALADGIAMYDLDTKYGYAESQETTEEDTKPEKLPAKKKTKEKIELAGKQPKSPASQGRGSADAGAAVPDIEKMSDAEIDALPADTLARLRGDFVD